MSNRSKSERAFKAKGMLKSFIFWPMYLGIILIAINISIFFIDSTSATIMAIGMLIYLIVWIYMYMYLRQGIMHQLMEFSTNYSQVQRQLLYELTVPYCILDNNGSVLWMNKAMLKCTGKKKEFNKEVSTIFPELTPGMFPNGDEPKEVRIFYNDRDYCVELKRISADILVQGVDIIESNKDSSLIAMYMFDETDINMYIQKLKDERFVVGLVYIDNYEEALESIDDVRRSLFIGLIDKRVNKYFAPGAAIVRKMEKDKYLVVFRYKYLEKLLADKFSILEDIKSVKIGNEMTITLSMGIGTGASDYAKNYEVAKAAMDLALGRGGDQAVIKNGDKIQYYGGKSQQMEKNTRVKVRVKAHA